MNVEEMLRDLKPQIKEQVTKNVMETVANGLSWSVKEKINEMTDEIMKEEILPEVRIQLMEKKPEIVHGIVTAVGAGLEGFGVKVAERCASQLAKKHSFEKLVNALFGKGY